MKSFIIKRSDGGISLAELHNGSIESLIKEWEKCAKPSELPVLYYREINREGLPNSEFFDAWIDDVSTNTLSINLDKAKDIQIAKLRGRREFFFDKYDKMMHRAIDLEDEAEKVQIRIKKQKLRDCTEILKSLIPNSIEDIKAATPSLDEF